MIDLQVYAPGLRESDNITHLGHSLETNPDVHYKVDSEHDMVYFEFLEPTRTLEDVYGHEAVKAWMRQDIDL